MTAEGEKARFLSPSVSVVHKSRLSESSRAHSSLWLEVWCILLARPPSQAHPCDQGMWGQPLSELQGVVPYRTQDPVMK